MLDDGLYTPHTITENMQFKAKNDLINEILEVAQTYLKGSQLMELNRTLHECFNGYEIFVDNKLNLDENYEENNKTILTQFLHTKQVEGASPRTVDYYRTVLERFLEYLAISLPNVDADLIREYLQQYQKKNDCSNTTLDNIRRVFSSFFTFCQDEGFLHVNPMRRVKKIKSPKKRKKAFTDIELEAMREYLNDLPKTTDRLQLIRLRDKAIFEVLLSSGVRVQELVNINREDIDMDNKCFMVMGKGSKERMCYFSAKAKFNLNRLFNYEPKKQEQYKTRIENNPALFIDYRTGKRMGINGIERRIREIGNATDVHAHPHKFRRTFATNLIRKEVPIEQVMEMMGHSNMDTTMIYTELDQEQIKMNHNRYSD